jgi:hypothetical protein
MRNFFQDFVTLAFVVVYIGLTTKVSASQYSQYIEIDGTGSFNSVSYDGSQVVNQVSIQGQLKEVFGFDPSLYSQYPNGQAMTTDIPEALLVYPYATTNTISNPWLSLISASINGQDITSKLMAPPPVPPGNLVGTMNNLAAIQQTQTVFFQNTQNNSYIDNNLPSWEWEQGDITGATTSGFMLSTNQISIQNTNGKVSLIQNESMPSTLSAYINNTTNYTGYNLELYPYTGGLYHAQSTQNTYLNSGSVKLIQAAPPPTVAQLANLSNDVYSPTPIGTTGYAPLPNTRPLDFGNGLVVEVYGSPDKSQLVFAIRGTVDIKNYLVDAGLGPVSNPTLTEYVKDVAQALKTLTDSYPNAHITLTGHSLGGALAQIMGTWTGADTVIFDAPGVADVYPTYRDMLNMGPWTINRLLGDGTLDTNYRLYGDQASLIGNQNCQVVTIGENGGPISALDERGIREAHKIKTLALALQPEYSMYVHQNPGIIGPDFIPELSTMNGLEVLATAVAGGAAIALVEIVTAFNHYFIDPEAYDKFVLIENSGSPFLNSLGLPILEGVEYYNLRYKIGDIWSLFQEIAPNMTFYFAPGVDGFEFSAFNQLGVLTLMPDSFWFDLTFASSGTFSATLTETNSNATPVPEPCSLVLFGIGAAGLGMARRRKTIPSSISSAPQPL